MKVDAVIPVYRPDHKFTQLMEALLRQSHRLDKIILMHTREEGEEPLGISSFNTGASSGQGETLIEVHELKKSEFDHGGTRNRGVGGSEAEYVLLMTDDAVPADEYLVERLLEGFREKTNGNRREGSQSDPLMQNLQANSARPVENGNRRVAVCYARQIAACDASPGERFSREYNYPGEDRLKSKEDIETLGIKAFFCSNVCAMYDRRIFDELGGFPDSTPFNEDMIFARRAIDAGFYIRYKADAQVIHSHSFTNMEQLKRNMTLARSQKAHPEIFGDVSSESEGIKYVKKAYGYFKGLGKGYLIVPFAVTCGFRFAGYRIGKLMY